MSHRTVAEETSPFTQAWLCSDCGEAAAHYVTNEAGQRFLLPVASCCPHCGAGPQKYELVSGRWTFTIEKYRTHFGLKHHVRRQVKGFVRTGLAQDPAPFTERFFEFAHQ